MKLHEIQLCRFCDIQDFGNCLPYKNPNPAEWTSPDFRSFFGRNMPGAAWMKDEAAPIGSCAWFLLDAGSGGGTGQCLDWPSLKNLELGHPWILAGGLNPDNLAGAIRQCGPDGVDLNSGLETRPGEKNHALIKDACHLAALEDNK